MVMIGSAGAGDPQFDTGRASIYVIVGDPEGNVWSFGTYDPFAS